MTTQTKASNPIEVAPQHHFSWPMVLTILMLGLLLGVLASNLFMASKIGVSEAPQQVNRNFPIRPNLTEPAKEDALTVYRQSERTLVPYTSLHLDAEGLAQYHQSEWGHISNTTLTENTLAAYHQSEWGLVPYKAEADRDIGLMEFFAASNETSRQNTEPGTLGALPNIDPADRKFFNPGYGVTSGIAKEAETLPTIDPADRKFFNPGYGAQTVMSRETEVLPTIDPADRKFFNPGYEVQIPIWFLLK